MRPIRAGVRGRTRPWIDRGTNHRVGWRWSDNPRTLIRQRNDAARSRGGRWCGHRSGVTASLWNSRRCLRLWNRRNRRRSSHCRGYRRSSLGDHRGRHGCCRGRRLGWFWGGRDWSHHRPRRRKPPSPAEPQTLPAAHSEPQPPAQREAGHSQPLDSPIRRSGQPCAPGSRASHRRASKRSINRPLSGCPQQPGFCPKLRTDRHESTHAHVQPGLRRSTKSASCRRRQSPRAHRGLAYSLLPVRVPDR